jgi:hypothetical protein
MPKSKAPKALKAESALALLEKFSAKPDNEELKAQVEAALTGMEMNSFEIAVAQVMGVFNGTPDRSEFVIENFKSKKLLAFAIKSEPPLLPTSTLVRMSIDSKFKSNLAAITKAFKYLKENAQSDLETSVLMTLRTALGENNEKTVADWIEKSILPLQVTLSSEDGAALLSALYGRVDPKKGASAGLKELFCQAIEWLTQPQNLAQMDRAITNASGLGAASYANIIHETRKMPFKPGSARYHFVMSLLKPRERKTVTFLANSEISKDFTLDGIGLLAENDESYARISENESALAALKDECRKRLKSEELPRVHYWLLKYPGVRNWLTDALIMQRLRPQDDFLTQLAFADGQRAGSAGAEERAVQQIEALKADVVQKEKQISQLDADLRTIQERFDELETRLRSAALNSQGAREDQVRQAQIDSVKVLIEFMNSIEVSGGLSPGLQSAVDSTREKLRTFGVSWRYAIGEVVPFVSQDHLASDLPSGALVKVLTPCYFMANTQTEIALVKARVLPQ